MDTKHIKISDYNYDLPDERIAKFPISQRDHSKLLVYKHGEVSDDVFFHLPDYLPKGASVAAAKEANGKALSDTMSNINASAEARKDQIEQTYRQKDDEYVNQLNQIEQGKANAISQAVQGVASVASKIPI